MEQDIEIQLWDYIDGTATEVARAHVAHMLATDAAWRCIYEELIGMQATIVTDLDIDEPSMRFTRNVMEVVAGASVAPATRKYVNPVVIRLLSGFFIASIFVCLVYAIAASSLSYDGSGWGSDWHVVSKGFGAIGDSAFMKVLVWVDVLIALLLLDSLVRRHSSVSRRLH